MDIFNVKDKSLLRITKLVGVTLAQVTDRKEVEDNLKIRGKYNDVLSIIDFMNLTKRTDITDFMFKVKKTVFAYINSQIYYSELDIQKVKDEIIELEKVLIFNKGKSYTISENDGKTFLSLDIESANFTALKEMSQSNPGQIDIDMTWPCYLKTLIPNDYRSASRKNVEQGLANLSFEIPDCIYTSKFFRQFILGDLTKLKYVWELKNIKMLSTICKLNLNNYTCVNSDEIIIMVQDYNEANTIIKLLDIPQGFRVKKFELYKIKDNEDQNYMIKRYEDGTQVLVNVHPPDYIKFYKKFIYRLD